MDTEDRGHFKTIAAAQVGLRLDSQTLPLKEPSNSPQDQAYSPQNPMPYCLVKAKAIFDSYRKDEVHSPETFCAGIAAILSDFPQAVIDYVADPRTGVAGEIKWVPNAAEVKEACTRAAARMAELAKPKTFTFRRYTPLPPGKVINLFVPSDVRGYDRMIERAKTEPEENYHFERAHICADGHRRDGIWVPLSWWERPAQKQKPESEIGSLIASEELARQLDPARFIDGDAR